MLLQQNELELLDYTTSLQLDALKEHSIYENNVILLDQNTTIRKNIMLDHLTACRFLNRFPDFDMTRYNENADKRLLSPTADVVFHNREIIKPKSLFNN